MRQGLKFLRWKYDGFVVGKDRERLEVPVTLKLS